RRTERGRCEPDQLRAVVAEHDIAGVEASVRDTGGVKSRDLVPKLVQLLVTHTFRGDTLERLGVGLSRDQERVAAYPQRRHHDSGNANAGLRGHQDRQGLVLDLLEPADRGAPRWISIGEKP